MKNAKLIRDNLPDFSGRAALYRLDPKYKNARFVVVSTAGRPVHGGETAVFASNKKGEVNIRKARQLAWMPNNSHASALRVMGDYEIVGVR